MGGAGQPELLGPASSSDQTGSPAAYQQPQIRCGCARVVCHHCADLLKADLHVCMQATAGCPAAWQSELQLSRQATGCSLGIICCSHCGMRLKSDCCSLSVPMAGQAVCLTCMPHLQAHMAVDGGLQHSAQPSLAPRSNPPQSFGDGVTSLRCDSEGALSLSCASVSSSARDPAQISLHDVRDIESQPT